MKIRKKFGLTLILALTFAAVLSLVGDKTVLAIKIGDDTFRNAQYNITALENGRPKTITVVIAGEQFTFTDRNTTDNNINLKTDGNDRFICSQSGSAGITLDGPSQQLPGGGVAYPGSITINYKFNTDEICNGNATDFLPKSNIAALYGVPGTPSAGGSGGGGTGAPAGDQTDSDTTCQKNSGGWSFAWAACPVLDAASELTNMLLGLFEDQLSFSVGQLGGIKDEDSGAFKIHQSWALMRDIATALLVVAMLVMVFSQAASFGPFDAYTVRKMLPKLVAAVILIQISWAGVSWAIDLINAVAKGLADLMYYPFGGAGKMDIWNLLENAKLSDGLLTSLNWAALLVSIALGVAFLFTMLGVAFVAIMALFFAVLTLIFRKILLIMLLIFVPLALIAWILPGTERYWKMWRENFLKALFMFPIAVAIIASGRIFAYVVGTQDNSQFLNLIFILVGFFGPLFILPKTFKWGGQAMSLAGNGLMKASSKVNEKPKAFFGRRQESWSQLRQARSAHRYSNPEEYKKSRVARVASLWQKPIDRVKAGEWDPTLGIPGSELRTQQKGAYLAKADEYTAKQRQEGLGRAVKLEERLNESDDRGGNKDDMYQDIQRLARGETPLKKYYSYDGKEIDLTKDFMGKGARNHRIARRAARDRMIQLGADTNWSHIDAEDERIRGLTGPNAAAEKAEWRKFLNDNKDQVLEKMPDLLKGVASVSDISADGISRMHGAGIKRMISKMDHDATDMSVRAGESATQASERRANSAARLTKFLTTYSEALNNSNTRGLLEQGGLRAVKAYVTRNNADRHYLLEEDPYNMHAGEDGRDVIREHTTVDPATGNVSYSGDLLLKPIIRAGVDGSVTGDAAAALNHLPLNLRTMLDEEIARDGSFHEMRSAGEVLTPGEIKIQHRETVARSLPAGASLADPAQRAAFKLQLLSDPPSVQTLARGIAYSAAPPGSLPEYQTVVNEMKADAIAAGTPEAKQAFNNILSQIQQAYMQRVNEVTQRQAATGHDAADARARAQAVVAPQIVNLESNKIP